MNESKTQTEKVIKLIELQVFEIIHKVKTLDYLIAELKLAREVEELRAPNKKLTVEIRK